MPPRSLPRSPFAGIGAGHSIVAGLAREPASPVRLHQHHSSTSNNSTPRQMEGLPSENATSTTLAAFSDTDFTSSGVSDSLSRSLYVDVILEQAAASGSSSASLSKSAGASAFCAWLGDAVQDYDSDPYARIGCFEDNPAVPRSASGSSITAVSSSLDPAAHGAKPSKIDPSRLFGRVQELIDTERSYVKRINVLHQVYAIPLRALAKKNDSAVISVYEAQRLFGNIGEIAGANRAFLNDLENLASQGNDSLRAGLGDVLFNHMSCFVCYTEYFANFEKAKHIERTLARNRAFCKFVDDAKYSVMGIGNTGLRDLLMEPIQRIPRYKLLIDAILNHVDPHDPLRSRLQQVVTLISRIASCEADEETKRAAVLWSFTRNVESFPAELISAHRRFIDCIDVNDFPLNSSATSSGRATSFSGHKPIHCTLFLFDDRIAIVKRAHASTNGRKLVGLDDIGKLTSQMKTLTEKSSHPTSLASAKRSELAFRGSIALADLEAQDLGGSDLQLALLRQPSHVTGDRWTGRPLRQYVVVDTNATTPSSHTSRIHPGSAAFDADSSAKLEKIRFLESVWRAKALYKARRSHCETRCMIIPASRRRAGADDVWTGIPYANTISNSARKVIYFHLHSMHGYAHDVFRTPVALSIDQHEGHQHTALGSSEASHPHAFLDILEVDEMEEEFVAQVRTKDAHDGEVLGELHRLSSADLGDRIVQLSDEVDKRFGNAVRMLALSQPGTPSGSGFRQRAKAAAGLENFGRQLLFGGSAAASSISSAGISSLDIFGSPARRSNSNASKSTLSSNAASISSRGMTYSTAGTSVSSRTGAFEAFSRGHDSPRSIRRFGRRRSSSVGPPSSAGGHHDPDSADEGEGRVFGRTRAVTPDPVSHLSTSAGNSVSCSPLKFSADAFAQGALPAKHRRSKTDTTAPTLPTCSTSTTQQPYQQRQKAETNDLCRTPSSAGRRPTGPREQTTSPGPAPRTEPPSPSWLSTTSTTPLNLRRKAVPRAGLESENEDGDTPVRARPASSFGVYSTTVADENDGMIATAAAQRRASGTKRPLSMFNDSDAEAPRESSITKRPSLGHETISTLPRAFPLQRISTEESSQRPSISESETSTERGHGASSAQPAQAASTFAAAPITPARTSSTSSKSAEARRRNESMEHALRLIKEELNLLRCDVEILQSSLSATEIEARTPRKRTVSGASHPLSELDTNRTAATLAEVDGIGARLKKVDFLYKDLDAKWVSVVRMHNRVMHDYTTLSSTAAAKPDTTLVKEKETLLQENETLAREKAKLETQLSAMRRKCESLTVFEADGRLENTFIHKAFNEELDNLYENTQKPESEELALLRKELKRTKENEHNLMVENKRLKRDLALEKSQAEAYREALINHNLL